MITEHQMQTCDLTHERGGNGFAVCEKLDDDYVRLTPVCGEFAGREAYLAATSMLSVSKHQDHMTSEKVEEIAELRKAIESGKFKVVFQKIIE